MAKTAFMTVRDLRAALEGVPDNAVLVTVGPESVMSLVEEAGHNTDYSQFWLQMSWDEDGPVTTYSG